MQAQQFEDEILVSEDDEELEMEPTGFVATHSGMLVSNAVGGVYSYGESGFAAIMEDFDLVDHPVSSIVMTQDSTIWAGTSDFSGLLTIEGDKLSIYADEFGLADNNINCLELTESGELLIGTPSGLSVFDGDFRNVMLDVDPDNMNVTAITVSESGTWHIGFFNGEVHSGLGASLKRSDSTFTEATINDLFEIDGNLWVATEGDGLFMISDTIHRFGTDQGLPSSSVRAIAAGQDRLYASTSKGLVALSLDGSVVSSYTRDNGFRWNDCQINA